MESGKFQNFQFHWDQSKIHDRTRFSKEEQSGLVLSNENKTVKRKERFQGDDYPSIRILGDKSIESAIGNDKTNFHIEWKIKINQSHGFIEIGIMNPAQQHTFLLKSFKDEVQIEKEGNLETIKFGETFTVNDVITVRIEGNQDGSTMTLHYLKNDVYVGAPFKDIPIASFYPMVGLNDNDDEITLN
ncbi:hypothetical protein CYY_003199 [Polysphondylium violaceum]|uniref:Uncharacterized protein n=1 Tax=Polysphondylium violaceum TaxID=133409 RepID=A0A8J4Q037_9MYCE|nr:hypothetical protein CYY_003199 [Polysphondylium violaceum]